MWSSCCCWRISYRKCQHVHLLMDYWLPNRQYENVRVGRALSYLWCAVQELHSDVCLHLQEWWLTSERRGQIVSILRQDADLAQWNRLKGRPAQRLYARRWTGCFLVKLRSFSMHSNCWRFSDRRSKPSVNCCGLLGEQHHSWWHLQTEWSDRYVFMWLAAHWKRVKLWWRGGHYASFWPPSAPLTAGSRGPSLTDWRSSTVTRTNTLNLLHLKQLICSLLHTVVIYKFAL